ncbi:MAG: glycoside hydrolase family 3 protein [Clostridia bacterium]|nr:glycoside hydrolase family 3 protein [Clostridia bacterium]
MDTYALCRRLAAEGAVLLKNEGDVLPLSSGTRLAVFGRAQTFYYKSGTGSGGLVHIDKEPCTIESLRDNRDLVIDETLAALYEAWVEEHPFEDGGGKWASEPWFQEEMPIDEQTAEEAAARNDAALIVFARTAGEDHDNADEEGSYRLTAEEERLLAVVTARFSRVIVALNVGNLIDTSFMERYAVSALLYIWQGGMAGADAFADLLSGREAPSGKLSDTVAYALGDYPSSANFGDRERNCYAEDIYVGYRYFETFAKDAVQYPFGFGLTYTRFEMTAEVVETHGVFTVTATVKNVGSRVGREVVQVYAETPCGLLGTPSRKLVAFAKTKALAPNEEQTLSVACTLADMAAYDDGGVTGHRSSYVLEAGEYALYVGTDVRSAPKVFSYTVEELTVLQTLEEVLAPVTPFERLCATEENGERRMCRRPVPLRTTPTEERVASRRPPSIDYTGDRGLKLLDVAEDKCSLETFLAQLTDGDLAALCCGEGMNSPKATPGTGGALGGQTERLSNFGIPVCCVTDGPSGVRLDSGEKASSLPNGTLLACTWDEQAVEELYSHVGEELKRYRVDALLGPGINLHRHPLCGRHFEYFSEDPFLTGMMAAAVTRGLANSDVYATIKHFCGNNQETNRYGTETVVSERALRELYLKPFELAVRHGENVLVMTAYNPVNGYWTASSYDLTSTVLRREWGFENFVMTDWWAKCNLSSGSEGNGALLQAMVRAENDVYMVCADAETKSQSILEGLESGYITRGELQRCASNILSWILRTNTFRDYAANGCVPRYPVVRDDSALTVRLVCEQPTPTDVYEVALEAGEASVTLSVRSDTDVLAQTAVTVQIGDTVVTASVCGTEGAFVELKRWIVSEQAQTCRVTVSHPDVVTIGTLVVKQ